MKKKSGFTLIELLAVIIILAIIALIAVPVIMNVLNKANKSAFKDTAYGLISAGELYFAEQQLELNGMSEDAEFTWPNNIGTLQVKGNVPDGTVLHVNTNGETALSMSNGRYCITKKYDDADITLIENVENCYFPYSLRGLATITEDVTEIAECATQGKICTNGISGTEPTKFAIQVNDSEIKNFYVIADDGTTITLIMSENLGNKVNWYDKEPTDDSNGPLTAIEYLKELTDDEWSNVPENLYTYSGTGKNGSYNITEKMRVRMLTYGEAMELYTDNADSLPTYMYGGTSYWTSTADSTSPFSYNAWAISAAGRFGSMSVNDTSKRSGVRPVITLTK